MPSLDGPMSLADMATPIAGFAILVFATAQGCMYSPLFKHLKDFKDRFYCATCVSALLNASCVSYSGLASTYEMFTGPDAVTVTCGVNNERHIARAFAPANGAFAACLTLGYFV